MVIGDRSSVSNIGVFLLGSFSFDVLGVLLELGLQGGRRRGFSVENGVFLLESLILTFRILLGCGSLGFCLFDVSYSTGVYPLSLRILVFSLLGSFFFPLWLLIVFGVFDWSGCRRPGLWVSLWCFLEVFVYGKGVSSGCVSAALLCF